MEAETELCQIPAAISIKYELLLRRLKRICENGPTQVIVASPKLIISNTNVKCNSSNTRIFHTGELLSMNLINQYLNKAVINFKCCFDGTTPLLLALALRMGSENIDLLIDAGADVNAVCKHGKNALIYVIEHYQNNESMIRKFLDLGVDVNHKCQRGMTPLLYAVSKNLNSDIIKMLIRAGANVHVHDRYGRNVFAYFGCEYCHLKEDCINKDVFKLLVLDGVEVFETNDDGDTVLHWVSCKYLIRLLLKYYASIEVINYDGYTPLMDACLRNDVDKVECLLALNANPNCFDVSWITPLCYDCSEKVVNLLVYHGGKLLVKNDKPKVLYEIKFNKFEEFCCAFIKNFLLFEDDKSLERTPSSSFVTKLSSSATLLIENGDVYNDTEDETETDDDDEDDQLRDNHGLPDGIVDRDSIRVLIDNHTVNQHGRGDGDEINAFLFIKRCLDEIKVMKILRIKSDLTFYEFCKRKQFYRSKFINISADEFRFPYKNIKKIFPIYGELITMRIKRDRCKKLKKIMFGSLENIILSPLPVDKSDFFECLPFYSLYQVCHYLSNKNIYNLFLASILS